ncbi:MAG TPA: aminotransferase class V-fold PLP-dependent enzyme [Rhabdochlamydiaceae bacterium]|nr:aminotransferase class V-fold PLP-dependent enzyme [Rhabdochlamydiaceae bacterium]
MNYDQHMTLDISRARQETPGCEHVLHFNNAGAALMPAPVIKAVNEHFLLETQIGGYEAADAAAETIHHFYKAASSLIHCSPHEIAFIENATRAWDMAFYSLSFKPGDRIVTANAEYASNYIAFLQIAKKSGVEIAIVPDDEYGQLSLSALKEMIDSRVKLIAITHVPTQGGLINPAEEVGKIARSAGIFYLLDTTQSIGQMPIDVEKIHCDALCATGRKYLRGPRGTGFLYVRRGKMEHMEPPFLDLHSATWTARNQYQIKKDASRFETWERNYSNLIGLKAAIEYAQSWGIENIWNRIHFLSEQLRKNISCIPHIKVRDLGQKKCGIVTFTVEGIDSVLIRQKLKESKINVSVSLPEYARLDLESRHLPSLVRASVHYYNTEAEIDRFCDVIAAHAG